jgi:replicative DNA helicase
LPTNIQPFDLYSDHGSEEQIIQAIYLNPDLIYQTDIRVNDFTNPDFRVLFEAMLTLYSDGLAFDITAIRDLKPELSVLKVSQIFFNAVTSANIRYHSCKVRKASFNRKCREIIHRLESQLGEESFMAEAEKAIMELYESQRSQRYYSVPEILSNIQTNINEAKKLSQYGIQTGFSKLNETVVGICVKHLWMLGGYTSYGKSTLLSQIINDICMNNAKVVLFSVEDSIEDKLIRLLATKTGIPIRTIVRGYGNEQKLEFARKEIESYNLHVFDDIYTLEEMDMAIKKHKLQRGVDVVCVDYIQNIITKGESIYDRMSEVAIKLQKMAKKHGVCILALSQVSTEERGKIALRGAQELASAADIVLWIDREPDAREFNLIIRKNRPFGKTGKIPMQFTEKWTGIEEIR